MKKIDKLWKRINQENDTIILKYHPNKDSLIEYLKFARPEFSVNDLFWGLRDQCLRAREFEEIQKRKNSC